MDKKVSKKALALELGVSRSMLYYKHKRPVKDEQLRVAIEAVMIKNPGYGHRRVADSLKVNRKRVLRVMKLYGLKPARRCRSASKPDDIGNSAVNFPDITRVFCPIAPNVLWISDFTFIPYKGSFIYLATILDRFTAEVLGASIMVRHTAELPLTALQVALVHSEMTPDWCHSDQGSEYNSDAFLSELAKHNIQVSMSPKASPWRNGAQESFFGRFKVEFGDPERFENLAELMEAIYAFIAYYNQERIHTRFRMSPAQFKAAWLQKQKFLTTYPQLMSLPPDPPPDDYCYGVATDQQHTDTSFTTTNFICFEESMSEERGT